MAGKGDSIVIDRPVDEVFAFVANVANLPKWQDQVIDASAEGDPAQGATFKQTLEMRGRRVETETEFAEFVPDERIRTASESGPVKASTVYSFQASGDATQVTMNRTLEASGPMKLMSGMMARAAKKNTPVCLAKLKELLEH